MNESLVTAPFEPRHQDYLEAICCGSTERASAIVEGILATSAPAEVIYRDIICPAQRELGMLWENGAITITQEHIATQISLSLLALIRAHRAALPRLNLRALICVPEGEKHFFAAKVMGELLYQDGWEVYFPGTDTPYSDLLEYIKNTGIDLVAISVSMEPTDSLRRFLRNIKKIPKAPKIIAGGAGATALPEFDALLPSLFDGSREARRLMGARGRRRTIDQFLTRVGAAIHSKRRECVMSQQELADAAGLDRAYLSAIENGKRNMSVDALIRISEALGEPLERLIVASTR